MGEYSHISHTFLPVYDESSKTLILGSFPSVKSREQGFYYGHPQNRFWKVLAAVCGCEVPKTIEEKKAMITIIKYRTKIKYRQKSSTEQIWRNDAVI